MRSIVVSSMQNMSIEEVIEAGVEIDSVSQDDGKGGSFVPYNISMSNDPDANNGDNTTQSIIPNSFMRFEFQKDYSLSQAQEKYVVRKGKDDYSDVYIGFSRLFVCCR